MYRELKKSEIPVSGRLTGRHPKTNRTQIVRDFIRSGAEAWEIYNDELSPYSAYNSFRNIIKNNPYFKTRAKALYRMDRIFLVRI